GIASAGAIAWLAGCSALYQRAMGRVGRDLPDPAALTPAPDVLEVRTGDGLRLLAWHLPGTLPAGVVVSGGNRAGAGDVLGIATALQRAGLHVVVHGWRGTPGCDPAPHTLGVHERRDLQAVIDAVERRLGRLPLGLLGYSLGGAVAIAVAASDPRVRAVCTDCAFDDPRRVLGQGVWRTLRIPGPVLTAPVGAVLALRAAARFSDFPPLEAVSRIRPGAARRRERAVAVAGELSGRSEAELIAHVLGGADPTAEARRWSHEVARLPAWRRRSLGAAGLVAEHGVAAEPALRLAALWELADRWYPDDRPAVGSPRDAALLLDDLRTAPTERIAVLLLDSRHRPIGSEVVALGTINASRLQPRDVLAPALTRGASAIVVGHNHPSG